MTLDPSKSPLVSLTTMMCTDPPEVEWDLKPLVMHGGRMVLSGEWATFKSWITLDMLLHISAGMDWLGWQCPKPRRCLYIDEEMPLPELWRRVRWLTAGSAELTHRLSADGGAERFQVLSQAGYRVDKTEWLLSCLKSWRFQPEVVAIETLRRTLNGSENEAERVAVMWQTYQVLTRTGATVWVNHHNVKPPSDPKEAREPHHRYAGSADILGGADQALALTRKRGQSSVTVVHTKARGAKEVEPFHVSLQFDDDTQRAKIVRSNNIEGVDPSIDEQRVFGMRD